MKLSIETYCPRDRMGDEAAFRMIKEAGFDGIDYSFYFCKPEHQMLGDDYLDRAKALRSLREEIGLAAKQAHAPFNFRMGKNEMTEDDEVYRTLIRSLEFAAILGVEDIIVHPVGHPLAPNFTEYNRRFYKSLIPYCEKFGIRVAVENLFVIDKKRGEVNIGTLHTPGALTEFIESLESPVFSACVDIGHAAITGLEPEEYLKGMTVPTLRALHVQDGDYRTDTHTLPFLGKFNWQAIMQTLAEIGYDGELNFETFKFIQNFPTELYPEALRLAEKTGRYLIGMYEDAKKNLTAGEEK